ncbi:putative nucleoprotein [Hubei odonate virus 8]|uniref:Putative nucleoprotein n=1 Tax=Hubei odonate virus 8 TaxID=1923003 RepID=A0A1L3KPF9_9VIRU|nr:putative nucleoprotein [Hubei odonate virus 8]APG79266.1 putative nucleoprotein [Hubei odonate virus 8]
MPKEEDYNLAVQTPSSLLDGFSVDTTYRISGVTPYEAIEERSGVSFDISDLIKRFSVVCPDFLDSLVIDQTNLSLDFAMKMIYEVGPASRSVKKGMPDKITKFIFPYKDTFTSAFVCTFKSNAVPASKIGNKIILTMKQANLLALMKMNELTDISVAMPSPKYPLTPLAGAVFSKDDIPTLANRLNMPVNVVISAINSSSASGGHYISHSQSEFAVASSIAVTRNVTSKPLRDSIIGKVVKQYNSIGKTFDKEKFRTICEFAHGGISHDLNPSTLIEVYEGARMSMVNASKLALATQMASTITTPTFRQRTPPTGITDLSTSRSPATSRRPTTPK